MKYMVNFVCMFGIILDNVIEGVSVVKKKKIELMIIKKNYFVMICVINIIINILLLN